MHETKHANPDHPVHPLVAQRWSPCGFSARPVTREDLLSLFEAARWAPSSYNEQPWRFLIATKEAPKEFEKLLSCLVDGNQVWAKNAPVLALAITSARFERSGKRNTAAWHDIGLAVANLTFEATARAMGVHQMIGILPDRARELFAIPEPFEAVTAVAIGYPAPPDTLAPELRTRDESPRSRKPLRELLFGGSFGEGAQILDG